MITLDVAMSLLVTVSSQDNVPVQDELDLVMSELVKLSDSDSGLDNPAVAWDGNSDTVTVEATVTADSWEEAVARFDSCVRSAIHGAGGRTPGWTLEKKSEHARLVDA